MKMPIKASDALPWAEDALNQATEDLNEAVAQHEAAMEDKIKEIMKDGRWSWFRRVPYTREEAEEIFDRSYYTFQEPHGYRVGNDRGFMLPSFTAVAARRSQVEKVKALYGQIILAGSRDVILNDDEMKIISPFIK